jgi:transposase
MNFTSQIRYNPETGQDEKYYRLKESYRDASGRPCTRILLNVGFIHGLSSVEIRDVARGLTYKYDNQDKRELWDDKLCCYGDVVRRKIDEYWKMLEEEDRLDLIHDAIEADKEKARRRVDVDTLEHKEARDIGAEWLCLQALRQVGFDRFLRSLGWGGDMVKLAIAHLIVRTVYTPSELRSMRIMQRNSAVCWLVDLALKDVKHRKVYSVADWFLKEKVRIEKYLCHVTDDLFKPTNRIMLFDLTNFYFEGRKEGSRKAQYGCSKEKRRDCKLLVLALCINTDGFIRYSSILEGNTADPKSLPDMVDKLMAENPADAPADQKVLVVMDAGISTKENLDLIKKKGYNYLCVTRKALTDYTVKPGAKTVTVYDCRKRPIELQEVEAEAGGEDYYLKVKSPAKALKEQSMNRSFRKRFEDGMKAVAASLTKKGGTKKYEAVLKRIGKLEGRYPSIARYYSIAVEKDEKNKVTSVTWTVEVPDEEVFGTYFLRTNVRTLDEKTAWDYYNLIREIECSNRQLKTDLNLRPIYHQKDDRSDAHLFLGLLAYWIVNIIRHQLKKENKKRKEADPDPEAKYPTPYWSEIVDIMKTQKAVKSEAVNTLGEKVDMLICSTPTEEAAEIYSMLNYKPIPFRRIKIRRTQQT